MRFCHFFSAVVAGQLLLHASADERVLAPTVVQSEPCTLVMRQVQFKDGRTQSSWRCDLSPIDASVVGTRSVSVDGLTDEDLKKARSGLTTVFAEGATISNGELGIASTIQKVFGTAEPNSPSVLAAKQGNQLSDVAGQSLNQACDKRSVLIVRVAASDSQPTSSLSQMRNFTFGLTGDVSNLKERFMSCSYGATQMVPFEGTTRTGMRVTRGGFSLPLQMNVIGVEAWYVLSEALWKLEGMLGYLYEQFDHVMVVLPPGTILYGDANWVSGSDYFWYASVYNDDSINYPAIQMHHIGHNLGLGDSSEGRNPFGDDTCMMGSPGYGLDTLNMCYNAAKSWQLGWYSSKRIALDFTQRTGFSGQLNGIHNYLDGAGYVSIKVLGSSFGKPDIYVGFNLATGINVDTQEAKNRVTVYSKEGGSMPSYLVAKLLALQTFTIPYFDNQHDLVITVKTISTSSSIPFADVDIYLSHCPPNTFTSECNSCSQDTDCPYADPLVTVTCQSNTCVYDTSAAPGQFVMSMRTDMYPNEISWQVYDECTQRVVLEGDSYGGWGWNLNPMSLRSARKLGQSRYKLTVRDSFGNGFSDGFNIGGFSASFDGAPIASTTGDFGYLYSSCFGSDGPACR